MKPDRFVRRSTDGFTILEVLMVVIMLAVLFGIAAPGWLTFMNRRRANASVDQIQQSLRLAQSSAIRTKLSQQVIFDTTTDPPRIDVRGSIEELGNGNLQPGMVSLQAPVTAITFDENGNLDVDDLGVSPPFAITIKVPANTGRSQCLIVDNILGATRRAEQGEPFCTP